jgi:RNA polymerase sigma factor (sigma-70 family)
MMESIEDDELIAASAQRPVAFAAVFDRHYPAVWRYLCRRVGPTLADDFASETFLRAFAGRAAYRPEAPSARPWLYGIATNVVRENARREERYLRAVVRASAVELAPANMEEVDDRIDAASLGPAVASALAKLAPPDRDVLLLLALTELDYEGIATATGVPVGTVRSRLHRARRLLRLDLDLEVDLDGSRR